MPITVTCFKESQFPLLPEVTIKNEGNVFVRDVPEGGVFAKAGVKDGDVIVSVNDHPFENISSPDMFRLLSAITGDVTIVTRSQGESGKKETRAMRSSQRNKGKDGATLAEKAKIQEARGESCPNCDQKFPSISAVSSHFTEVHSNSRHPPGPKTPTQKPQTKTPQTDSKEKILRENHVLKKKNERMVKEIENFRMQHEVFKTQLEQVSEKSQKLDLQKEIKVTEQIAKIKDLERDLQIKQKTIEQLIKDNEFLAQESQPKDDPKEKAAMEALIDSQKKELDTLKLNFKSEVEEMSKKMGAYEAMNDDIQSKLNSYDELQNKIAKLERELKSKDEKNKKYKENFSKVTKELQDMQEKQEEQEKRTLSEETQEELNDLRGRLTIEMESSKEARAELDKETKFSTELKIKVEKVTEKYNNAKDGLKNALEEGKKLKSLIKSVESNLGKAVEREKKMKADYEESLNRNKVQEEIISQLKGSLVNLELEVDNLKESLEKIESDKKGNQGLIADLTERESAAKQQTQKDKKIISVLTKEVEDLRNKIEDTSNDKSVSNAVEEEILKTLTEENESLKERIANINQSESGAREQLKEKLEDKDKQIAELNGKVEEVELQNVKLELKITRFDEFIEEYTYFMRNMRKKERSERLDDKGHSRNDEYELRERSESRKRSYYRSSDPRSYHDYRSSSKRYRRQEDDSTYSQYDHEDRKDSEYRRKQSDNQHQEAKSESLNNVSTKKITDEASTSVAKIDESCDFVRNTGE